MKVQKYLWSASERLESAEPSELTVVVSHGAKEEMSCIDAYENGQACQS